MKLFVYTFLIIVFNLHVSSAVAENSTKPLRDGYRLQIVQNDTGEIKQLFHQKKLLGESHNYSISPSGEYATFQNSPGGKLFLYRKSDGVLEQLTDESPGAVKTYKWNETLEIVRIYFDDNQEALSFAIE